MYWAMEMLQETAAQQVGWLWKIYTDPERRAENLDFIPLRQAASLLCRSSGLERDIRLNGAYGCT